MKRVHELVEPESEDEFEPGSAKPSRQACDLTSIPTIKRLKSEGEDIRPNHIRQSYNHAFNQLNDLCQSLDCVQLRQLVVQQGHELQSLTAAIATEREDMQRERDKFAVAGADFEMQLARLTMQSKSRTSPIAQTSMSTTDRSVEQAIKQHADRKSSSKSRSKHKFAVPSTHPSTPSQVGISSDQIIRSLATMDLDFNNLTDICVLQDWLRNQRETESISDIMRAMRLFITSELVQLECLNVLLQLSNAGADRLARHICGSNGYLILNTILTVHKALPNVVHRTLKLIALLYPEPMFCQSITSTLSPVLIIELGNMHNKSGEIVSSAVHLLSQWTVNVNDDIWQTSSGFRQLRTTHEQM